MAHTIAKAIKAININAQFTYQDEDFSTLKWLNGTTAISEADIKAKQSELDTTYTNNKYQRDRRALYPKIREQLDMLYWDKVNGTDKWKEAIAKVKADNPKP